MAAADPHERQQVSRLAAHASWARTADRTARTEKARRAFAARFENEVDPDRRMAPAARAAAADSARRAHFRAMARRSAKVRRGNPRQGKPAA